MSNLGRIKAGGAEVEVVLKDQQFQRAITNVENRMRQLKISLPSFSLTRPIAGFAQMQKSIDVLGRSFKTLGDRIKAVAGPLKEIGQSFLAGGVGALFGIALPTREYLQFSDAMQILRAVSGATADEFERLVRQARDLGSRTSFSPQEVGAGQVELARGGFSPTEIEDSTASVLSLAKATNTDLATAGNTAIRIIRGFNLEASEMAHVADVVAATVNGSAQVIDDYAEAIKLVGSIASETGTSIEEASAAIGILADNGLRGSLAGTGLRRILLNLASPTQRQQFEGLMQTFGGMAPAFEDAEGNLRPLLDVMAELNSATADLGSAQKIAAFEQLFGRGTNAALKLATSAQRLRDLASYLETDIEGLADKIAEVMEARIGGAFRRFRSAIQDAWLTIGAALEPVLSGLFDIGSQLTLMVNRFIEANPKLVATIAAVAVGAVAAGAALLSLGLAVGFVGAVASGLGAMLQATAIALGAMTSPLGIMAAALAATGEAFLSFTDVGRSELRSLLGVVSDAMGRMRTSLGGVYDAIASGDLGLAFRIVADTARSELLRLQGILDANFGGLLDWFRQAFSREGAASIAKGFAGPFATFFADVGRDVTAVWQTVVSSLAGVWQGAAVVASQVADEITDAWYSVTGAVFVVSEASKAFVLSLLDSWQSLASGPLTQLVGQVVSAVRGMAGPAVQFGQATASALLSTFSALGSGIASVFGGIDALLRAVLGPVDDNLDGIVADINRQLNGLVSVIIGSIGGFISPLVELLVATFGWLVDVASSAFGVVSQFFAATFEQMSGVLLNFGTFVSLLWTNVGQFLSDAFGNIGVDFARAVDGMFGSWASFIGGIKKLWASAGTYLLQSIVYIADQLAGIVDYFAEIAGFNLDLQASTKAAQGYINQGLQDRFAAIEAETAARNREADDRQQRNARQNALDLGEVEMRLQESRLQAKEAHEAKLAKIRQSEELKQRFDPQGNPNESVDDFDSAGGGVKKQIAAVGSFNIASLNRIGFGSSYEKQSLDLAKQTAKHVKEVADNTRQAIRAT